jgi:MvaI/BcnI restriction endonuclease family
VGITKVEQLQELFQRHGINQVYVKHLARRQDNDKNQIYLGRGIDGIANILPPQKVRVRARSESTAKSRSEKGSPIMEALIDLAWLGRDGTLFPAPGTRVIDYFQYPEARISGFIDGCDNPPDALRRRNLSKYGKRILLLGIVSGGYVIGFVLTEAEDPLVGEFPELPDLPVQPLLKVLVFGEKFGQSPTQLLLDELTVVHRSGWQPSVSLRPGEVTPGPFKGWQGGGYTLEALLSIPRNADAAPDKHGYEIKSYTPGKKISLMTPTANGGREKELGIRKFVETYGTVSSDGSHAFSGVYRCNQPNKKTGFVMRIEGYDADNIDEPFDTDTDNIRIVIRDEKESIDISVWTFDKIAAKWGKKHASACYVPRDRRDHAGGPGHDYDYRFSDEVFICEGTSIRRLFRAIHAGVVYYDPAHRIYLNGIAKARPQWRISATKKFEMTLAALYREVRLVNVG